MIIPVTSCSSETNCVITGLEILAPPFQCPNSKLEVVVLYKPDNHRSRRGIYRAFLNKFKEIIQMFTKITF